MRQSLQDRLNLDRAGTSYTTHAGAPTGGLNTRDSVVGMDSRDALVLDNWFPQQSEVWQRGGYAPYATGMTGIVKAMGSFDAANGTKQFIAFTDAGAYDITAGGVISGIMTGSALTNGYVQTLKLTNSAGTTFLWICNGIDVPKFYNGTVWAPAVITGLTPTTIVQAWLFKHRVWFLEQNTMNAWYLPIDSIQGAATQYPMGNLFRRGGYLVAGTNWTIDGGEGPDDAMVLISSEGELAIFKGTDPNSASSWSLSGIFFVGKPCGRKCFFRLGGDVGLLTENGVYPLSRALQLGSMNFAAALSNKIQPSIAAAVAISSPFAKGYEGCVYPKLNALLVNMPNVQTGGAMQFVMNTVTGQWSTFSGWNTTCFEVFQGQLYFGDAGGTVQKAWVGVSDAGALIYTTVYQAFQTFGTSARMKKVRLLRFLLEYDGSLDVKWAIAADYSGADITSFAPGGTQPACAIWDVSAWDTSWWCMDVNRKKQWKAVFHPPGYALSLRMITSGLTNDPVKWAGTDFILDRAGQM